MSAIDFDRPPFIVIEGLDGAGTTTQTARLARRLGQAGQPAVTTREPSDGPIGALIRQMLSRRVVTPTDDGYAPAGREVLALLFAADRLDHITATVRPCQAAGKAVVSDRYYHSSFAYQGDVDGADRMDLDWVRTLNERAIVPDLTLFLAVDVDTCLSRMGARASRDIYETRDKLARLEQRYDEVMALLESEGQPLVRVDATEPLDAVSEAIWRAVVALARG